MLPTPTAKPPPLRTARVRRAAWAITLILLAGGATWLALTSREDAPAEAPTTRTVLQPSPNVVLAVQQLARLEGAVFHLERVVDLRERQSRMYGLVDAEDAILLVAAGDVIAGVDLGQLRPGDVQRDPVTGRVTLVLPRAEVLSHRLDNARTYVHSRTTDALATRKEDLETRARQEAERGLVSAATEAGILQRAEASVGKTVAGLLRSLGFTDVVVEFRDQPALPEPSSGH